jgi:hypothetical protein
MLAVYLFLPIVVIATFAIGRTLRTTNDEARRLRVALQELGQLRPALAEVQSEADRTRQAFEQLRRR